MIEELPAGQTHSCQHENTNTSGICDLCLGKPEAVINPAEPELTKEQGLAVIKTICRKFTITFGELEKFYFEEVLKSEVK